MPDKYNPTDWSPLAFGLGIMFIILGVGGCGYLWQHADAEMVRAKSEAKAKP